MIPAIENNFLKFWAVMNLQYNDCVQFHTQESQFYIVHSIAGNGFADVSPINSPTENESVSSEKLKSLTVYISEISSEFQTNFKKISRPIQENSNQFQEISNEFQEILNEIRFISKQIKQRIKRQPHQAA